MRKWKKKDLVKFQLKNKPIIQIGLLGMKQIVLQKIVKIKKAALKESHMMREFNLMRRRKQKQGLSHRVKK